MRKNKFKVGDIIKANEMSDDNYLLTNLRNECVGVVTNVWGDGDITIKITSIHESKRGYTEDTFTVHDSCFDLLRKPDL